MAAFLYPGYASYKTLSQRPASEADLERWLMYWSVLGCVVGVEYVAEWLVSWYVSSLSKENTPFTLGYLNPILSSRIPLYSTFKAIFFLYLALPQTQGSTYIYVVHLRPFFARHEGQIDMAIAEVRVKAYRFLQEKARTIWAAVIDALTSGAARDANTAGVGGGQIDQPSPTAQNPTGGPTQLLSSLWTSYGPAIIAGGTSLLKQTAAATLPAGAAPGTNNAADASGRLNALNTPPGSTFFHPAADPISERRRQLEAELASLPPSTSSLPMPTPIPPANNPAIRPGLTPSSSSSSVRSRVNSGKFEEIQGGDVEGYKVDEDEPFVGGFDVTPRKPAGWFSGWGSGSGGSSSRGNYERVKDE